MRHIFPPKDSKHVFQSRTKILKWLNGPIIIYTYLQLIIGVKTADTVKIVEEFMLTKKRKKILNNKLIMV